ncbi:MAG: A24 family peptidase [Candidatus Woesearchaeota archaeon]|nr:A24 family peptidase [Candidatus Woesearchaeota archaeon]
MVVDNLIHQIIDAPLNIIIPYAIAFLVLLIASYTDLKTREVPDWLNFSLIGTGFGINLLFSIIFFKINFILASLIGFAIFFAIAWVMFYAGQWGGGDSKILMGLGALIGIDFLSKNYFLTEFLINALLIGALYGILWSIFLIFRNKNKFVKMFRKSIKNKKVLLAKKIILALFIIMILISVLNPDRIIRLMMLYLAVILIFTFYLWVIIKIVEDCCMLKYVKPQKLTEGDWIAKDVKINGKYITGPKDLGIEKKKIRKLIELYKRGKVKKILIKEGIPFVPSFLIAYVVTLIYGNLVFLII